MGKTEVQQVGLNLVDPNSKFGFLEVFKMLIAIWTFVTLSFGDMKMGPFCWGKHMTYDDATHISSCLARNIIQGKRQRAKARHCKRYMVLFSQWKSAVHPYPFICFKHLFQNYFYMLMFDVFVHVGFYMIRFNLIFFQRIFLGPKASNSRLCCSPDVLMLNHVLGRHWHLRSLGGIINNYHDSSS